MASRAASAAPTMPALLRMATDSDGDVRCVVAERLPVPLLSRLSHDADWRVRWAVSQRADTHTLATMCDDTEPEIRQAVRERLANDMTPTGASHGRH